MKSLFFVFAPHTHTNTFNVYLCISFIWLPIIGVRLNPYYTNNVHKNIICIHLVCKRLHYYCEQINFGLSKSNVYGKNERTSSYFFSLSLSLSFCLVLSGRLSGSMVYIIIHLNTPFSSWVNHYVRIMSCLCRQTAFKRLKDLWSWNERYCVCTLYSVHCTLYTLRCTSVAG